MTETEIGIRFDKEPDEERGTNWDGTIPDKASEGYYSEEFVVGPSPSKKFKRYFTGVHRDDKFYKVEIDKITDVLEGVKLSYTANGIEISETLFDGRQSAAQFKLDFDYNVEDGYIFNGIIDSTSYREAGEKEDWLGMSYDEILTDIFINHNNRKGSGTGAPIINGIPIEYDTNELPDEFSKDSFAGPFSFRQTPIPQVIDQIIKREGNTLWWVEYNNESEKWRLKFKTRDLSTDEQLAKMHKDHTPDKTKYNVTGLDITGPATDGPNSARIIDEGAGFKFQVGGPGWFEGKNGAASSPGPVSFQLEWTPATTPDEPQRRLRWVRDAVGEAAAGAGYTGGARLDYHKAFGYCNLRCTIDKARGDDEVPSDAKTTEQQEGFFMLPASPGVIDQKNRLTVRIRTPMANEPEPRQVPSRGGESPTIKWQHGLAFPSKPDKRGQPGVDVDDPWRIDKNLLTHPDIPFAIEVQASHHPVVVFYDKFDVTWPSGQTGSPRRNKIDKEKALWEDKVSKWISGEVTYGGPDLAVSHGFWEEHSFSHNGRNYIMGAMILFFKPSRLIVEGKVNVDTHTAHLLIETNNFRRYGDWSAKGRQGGNQIPTDILDWVTDSEYSDAGRIAGEDYPLPKIYIPLEEAFMTGETVGSSEWGQQFIFHGVYTTRMPKAESLSATAPHIFQTEQGDYEQHNVIFNQFSTPGFPCTCR